MASVTAVATARARVRSEAAPLLLFLALAVLVRLPSHLYSVINWDESHYLLIARQINEGVLPYTGIWDRKPVGLFALFALFDALPGDAILASRVAASLAVGFGAWCLYVVAGLLFRDDRRTIGLSAGLAYVAFSLTNGGLAANAEPFFMGFGLLGLLWALRGLLAPDAPRYGPVFAAGLTFGVAIQIKQSVLFDMLAFLAGFYLLTTPRPADLPRHALASAPALGTLALGAALPTLAVVSVYAASGHWREWIVANFHAYRGFVDDPDRPLVAVGPTLMGLADHAPLWLGAALAVVLVRRLAEGAAERRAVAFLVTWAVSVFLGILLLRMSYDHYFVQFLPPLCLLAGLALDRGLLRHFGEGRTRVALALTFAVLLFAVGKTAYVNAFFVAKERYVGGVPHANDVPRRIAADFEAVLAPGEPIYVFNHQPIIYLLADAGIPTRFVFPYYVTAVDAYGMVDGMAELKRILATRPRFIVVREDSFDPPPWAATDPAKLAVLMDALTRGYRRWAVYDEHTMNHHYPFTPNPEMYPAVVYERVDPRAGR